MFGEFKSFIMKGNVLDLAVAVIIGAAFATITTSLTADIIMPLVSAIFGNADFSNSFIILGAVPSSYEGALTDYAALKAAGVPMLGWGAFLTVVINFVRSFDWYADVTGLIISQSGQLSADLLKV